MENKTKVKLLTYYFCTKGSGEVLFDIHIPTFGSVAMQRETASSFLIGMKQLESEPQIRKLMLEAGGSIGAFFCHNGIKYPIVGFGEEFTEAETIKNRALEFSIIKELGFADQFKTEKVYSVALHEYVDVIV